MTAMRAVVIKEQGGDFVLEQREVPQPGFGEVLVRVHACGVCHSDVFAKEGYPGVSWPVVPGHEIAGEVAALGEHVPGWSVGQRVGVGWFGGNCGYCEWCRRGQLIDCENMAIPGVTMDGGYADYVVVPATALALMPDDLTPEEAGPLLGSPPSTPCAPAARPAEVVSRCSVSVASGISRFSSRATSDSKRSQSHAARRKRRWLCSWGRITTSTRPPATRQSNFRRSVGLT
jgi:hypothetical protein